jgi:hypothetical protein
MATKVAEKVAPVEELVIRAKPLEVEVPAEIQEKAQRFIDNYAAMLTERTEAYVQRMAEARPEAVLAIRPIFPIRSSEQASGL